MFPSEVLRTERLQLRRQLVSDSAARHQALATSSHIRKFQKWAIEPSTEQASIINNTAAFDDWEDGRGFGYSVYLGNDLIGCIDFRRTPGELPGLCEFGYWFREDACGQGFAYEACMGMLTAAFQLQDVSVMDAHTDAANTPSKKLLHRLGLTFTGRTVPNASPGEMSTGFDEIWRIDRASFLERVKTQPAAIIGGSEYREQS